MVGRLVVFLDSLFSSAMLVLGRVHFVTCLPHLQYHSVRFYFAIPIFYDQNHLNITQCSCGCAEC